MPNASHSAEDELLLIRMVLEGDPAAFDKLCEPYQWKLQRHAARILGNLDEARDAVQEAFLKALLAIGTFRAEARFETWLTQIVINEARMALRRRKRRSHWLSPEMEDRLVSREDDGYQSLARKQRLAALHRGIDELPDFYREVIHLRLNHMNNRQCSSKLDISLPALKSRQFRAINLLRARLNPDTTKLPYA